MPTIERCLRQINPPLGNFPGKSILNGECKNCKYDPDNNKKCPCYEPFEYSFSLNSDSTALPVLDNYS